MKKAIVVGLALIPMLLLITSCGVPQEEYDKVGSDLAVAQTQIQSLQGDLATTQIQIQSLQGELSAKESELEAIKQKLEQSKARLEVLNVLFIPAMTGELDRMTEAGALNLFLEWRDKVKDVGDPALTAKFEAMLETFSDEAMISFLLYLLESTADVLE